MSERNALWQALGLPAENPTGNALNPLWDVAPFGSLAPTPSPTMRVAEALLGYTPPASKLPLGNSLGDIFGLFPPPSVPTTRLGSVTPTPVVTPEVKRKVYFAFDFDDLLRVNNVRHVGKIGPREVRNARTFYDRSIWESRNIKNVQNLKNLMRGAMKYSSVVCALVGTTTYQSRWAKYEIARSVIDEKGLLAVHINSINHNLKRAPDRLGVNPLHVLGVYHSPNGNYYLYEKHLVVTNAAASELGFEWRPYEDHTDPVPLPRYIPTISVDRVMPLSLYTAEYDMVQHNGYKNIGAWLDAAAAHVGR